MFLSSLLSSFLFETDEGYVYEEVWTDYAKQTLSSVFLYTAIALAVILVCIGVFVKFKKPDALLSFLKTAVIIALTFALSVIIVMLTLGFAEITEKGYAAYDNGLLELVPPIVLAGVIVVSIIASYVAHFFSPKVYKLTLLTSLSVIAAAVIATVICLVIYFTQTSEGDYGGTINSLALYLCAGGMILAIVAVAILTDLKNKTAFDSRCIALAGITIALSFALSYIRMFSMPQGGSITLASLLPIMLFAYVYGPKKGIFVGFIYGALQAIQDPYLIHPAQFLLDYPVAFAAIGLTGVFNNVKQLDKLPQVKFALGAVVAGALRFISHVFSGVFAFSSWAPVGQEVWIYGLGYNSFVFVDLVIVIAVGVIVLSSKTLAKRLSLYAREKKVQPAVENGEVPESGKVEDVAPDKVQESVAPDTTNENTKTE